MSTGPGVPVRAPRATAAGLRNVAKTAELVALVDLLAPPPPARRDHLTLVPNGPKRDVIEQ